MEILKEVKFVLDKLKEAGYEAYIVGGCVRDFLRGVEPKDWDVATNAKPEEIQKVFSDSFYKNKFGTVTVRIQKSKIKKQNDNLKFRDNKIQKLQFIEVEITPFRTEEKYSDKRHPDQIHWAKSIEEDLARRDFTINAMAATPMASKPKVKNEKLNIIDLFKGQKDLANKLIRAVGKPEDRFSEDALRMMRAVRLATTLNFEIEPETFKAIQKNAFWIKAVSKERIRDELVKVILSDCPDRGILLLKDTGLLKFIVPELEKGIGVSQNRHHIYTIFQHSVLSLKYCPSKKLEVRLAALFHDIAKPETKRGKGPDATFYNHDRVGAKITMKILGRLRFSKELIEKVALLVKNHMFYYNVGEVTESGVRRLIRRVGLENMEDLIALRIADRLGSGVPKAKPYKLRHLEYLIKKVSKDPISVKMLKVGGGDVMRVLNIKPGPMVGAVLNALLAEVLEDPSLNKKDILEKKIKEFGNLSLEILKERAREVEEKKEEIEAEEKKKFYLK